MANGWNSVSFPGRCYMSSAGVLGLGGMMRTGSPARRNPQETVLFGWLTLCLLMLLGLGAAQHVQAAPLACSGSEIAQTFTFGGANTWPGGSNGPRSYTVGTAPNSVTLTFTNTQSATPFSGDPSLRQSGNNANALVISGINASVGATLATMNLATNKPINKLVYNVYDMDYSPSGSSNFRDRIVATMSGSLFPTAMTAVNATNVTTTPSTGDATATNSANCPATDTNCNVEIQFNRTGINSAALQFLAAHASGTTVLQSIGLGQYSWCLPRASLTLRKTSVGGTGGAFGFALTNTAQTTGSITTTAAGTPQQVDGDTAAGGTQPYMVNTANGTTAITINENSLPSGWTLTGATCTNAAGSTVGSLSGSTYTIPAASVTSGEAFTCTFTNTKSPTLQLAKAWGANSSASDSATIAATTGGSNNTSPFTVAGGTAGDRKSVV